MLRRLVTSYSRANAVRRRGHPVDAYADRIVNCVEDRGRRRYHSLLADSFGAERSDRRRVLNKNRFHRRHIAGGGDQVVMKILTLAGKEFLHQRHPQPLRCAAFDLPFNQSWINGAANIMRGGYFQYTDGAQFRINGNLHQVRPKSKDSIWNALPIFIQRTGGGVERCVSSDHVAVLVERQLAQGDSARPGIGILFCDPYATILEIDDSTVASVREAQNGFPEFRAGQLRRFAGNESLAGRGRLAAVGSDRGIGGDKIEAIDGSTERVSADLGNNRVLTLADIHRTLVKSDSAVRLQPYAHS